MYAVKINIRNVNATDARRSDDRLLPVRVEFSSILATVTFLGHRTIWECPDQIGADVLTLIAN